MGTPLGPKYIPYTYMDPLGKVVHVGLTVQNIYCARRGLRIRTSSHYISFI